MKTRIQLQSEIVSRADSLFSPSRHPGESLTVAGCGDGEKKIILLAKVPTDLLSANQQ